MTPCNAATAAAAHPTPGIFAALAATLYFRSKGVQPRYVPHEVYRSVALPDLQLQVRAHAVHGCSAIVAVAAPQTYMCTGGGTHVYVQQQQQQQQQSGRYLELGSNLLQQNMRENLRL
jgi:hypothetical protein